MTTVPAFLGFGAGKYTVGRSLRFRASASAYLNRTLTTPTNNLKWTWSAWLKRGTISANNPVFYGGDGSSNNFAGIIFTTSDTLQFAQINGGVYNVQMVTSAVFRDPSAWYHIIIVYDSANATSTDRVQIYINGIRQTVTYTTGPFAQNTASKINSALGHYLGKIDYTSIYFDGYLAEVNFIDGQALTPSSFGAYDTNGVWQPLKYTGTYGTNGFYLPFSNTTSTTTLVQDSSGNGNNWTPNNISLTAGATYDSMIDSPTNSASSSNYCVMNPLNIYAVTPSNGNLTASGSNAGYRSTMAIPSSGKWYWETVVTTFATQVKYAGIGQNNSLGTGVRYESDNGQKVVDGTNSAYGATWGVNDVISVAVDADASTVTFYKNNVSQGSISYTFLTNDVYVPVMTSGGTPGSDVIQANFGQRPFSYTPPTGYNALNTANLPYPTITNGAAYMAATTYTGNGSTQSINNGTNTTIGTTFQPDFVWGKIRNIAGSHNLFDSVRGNTKYLLSDSTSAELTATDKITSFNSNGFSLGADSTGSGQINTNGNTFVAWQWKANGTPAVTNTSGSITSTVSANTTAGFSVVTYTGTAVNATVGHGLGVAPSMVITKNRSAAANWLVYHTSLGGTQYLGLNQTIAAQTNVVAWNNTNPTSSVFSIGTDSSVNGSGNAMVAYCFAAIRGFSAFGSYTGNGSADGPFVFTNFRPRWILFKRSDSAQDWMIIDSSRDTYNVAGSALWPDLSNYENQSSVPANSSNVDFLSNGFKIRNPASGSGYNNASGGTYIYAAFAENPFNFSRAR